MVNKIITHENKKMQFHQQAAINSCEEINDEEIIEVENQIEPFKIRGTCEQKLTSYQI
jgi:hypothetical protein